MTETPAQYNVTSPKLCFIGAGNMTKAIISGLIESGYNASEITATNPSQEKLDALARDLSINVTRDNCQATSDADVIILAVKPAVVPEVCREISGNVNQQLVVSVAAGVTTDNIRIWLQSTLPTTDATSIARAMPNTPCLLAKGTIGVYVGDEVTETHKTLLTRLFEAVGKLVWIEQEQQMDIVTALSGSGPAYYFYLTQSLIQAGVELGLPEQTCTELVNQTALGAAAMLNQQPQISAQALGQSVTSPNGTTAAAIKTFDDQAMQQIIKQAVNNATTRGIEMSKTCI